MSIPITALADIRRNEHYNNLMQMDDQDMCEMIRAHFESHPALPGEKTIKDEVNQRLSIIEDRSQALADGFVPAANTPFDKESGSGIFETAEEKQELAQKYAKTRIRETSLKEGNYYLDFRRYDPSALKREPVQELPQQNGTTVYVEKVNVELQNNGAGEVYVLAEQSDGGHKTIGSLPDNFLKNNPMNVDSCAAELQIADFSNGNMKNISAKVVVDTDLMSGDVIDLDEDLLSGLEQSSGLEQ